MRRVVLVVTFVVAIAGAYAVGTWNASDSKSAANTPSSAPPPGSTTSSTAAPHVDDNGLAALANGEMAHEYGPDTPLDATTRARLAYQLSLTRLIADRFPTLKDARVAGSKPAGAFGPGLGIHMGMPPADVALPARGEHSPPPVDGELTDEQIVRPTSLLYDGTGDDARLAGFMYYSLSPDEPAGFAGPNDHWHTHGNLCLKMSDEGIETIQDAKKTKEACEAKGGFFVEQTTWMVHVWTIPGYESNRGVFSDINPAIACSDGTYHTVDAEVSDRYQLNKCRADAA
jgi:hypothetical protein